MNQVQIKFHGTFKHNTTTEEAEKQSILAKELQGFLPRPTEINYADNGLNWNLVFTTNSRNSVDAALEAAELFDKLKSSLSGFGVLRNFKLEGTPNERSSSPTTYRVYFNGGSTRDIIAARFSIADRDRPTTLLWDKEGKKIAEYPHGIVLGIEAISACLSDCKDHETNLLNLEE